ncbi:hypothetical protein [Mesorhizobium sp. CA7]|uniref:hypothetical protein n=1 Tax=Mesorhizobium sp. CA7 TaxID=588501 RepID=UPI001CCA684B|nr:hypothetical protein [Mesorhizobium sp. CA7]MBZ9815052.1 hypothetical protein [Mesorhizobium sp. CA7]
MFAIEAYRAERQVYKSEASGAMTSTWEPCLVVGVTKDEDGEFVYVVEMYSGQDCLLATEPYVRRLP